MITLVQATLELRILGAVVLTRKNEALPSTPLLNPAHEVSLVLSKAPYYVLHEPFVGNLLREVSKALAEDIGGIVDLFA